MTDVTTREDARPPAPSPDEQVPDRPKLAWGATLKRTISRFGSAGGSDLAAALTYFALLSLAPMLLALSTMVSFVASGDATEQVVRDLGGELGVQEDTLETINGYIASMGEVQGAGILLVVGLVAALWSASNYVNAFSRMMNAVYGIPEGRAVWKLRPWLLGITVLVVVMLVAIILAVSLSGSLSAAIFGVIGLSDQANMVWNIVKWPVIVLMLIGIVGVLYWGTPNVRKKFRWISWGNALAVIVAGLAAGGFGLYLSGFGGKGSYNATYGALGAVIILLLLIFIVNNVLVLGAVLDAELERARQLAAGLPAEEEIQLPPRDQRGTAKKEKKAAALVREAREARMKAAAQLSAAGRKVGLKGRGRG